MDAALLISAGPAQRAVRPTPVAGDSGDFDRALAQAADTAALSRAAPGADPVAAESNTAIEVTGAETDAVAAIQAAAIAPTDVRQTLSPAPAPAPLAAGAAVPASAAAPQPQPPAQDAAPQPQGQSQAQGQAVGADQGQATQGAAAGMTQAAMDGEGAAETAPLRPMRDGARRASGAATPAQQAGASAGSQGAAASPPSSAPVTASAQSASNQTASQTGNQIAAAVAVQGAGPGAEPEESGFDPAIEARPQGGDVLAGRAAKTDGTGAAQAAHAHAGPRADAAAIVRLAQQIGQKAGAGASRFEIRMDPPELGRIDVRLHIDAENRAQAVLTVERADTLNDLARQARALERALEDAGLKLGQNGLEFTLKRDGQGGDDAPGAARRLAVAGPDADAPNGAVSGAAGGAADGDAAGHVLSYGFRIARAARVALRV